MKFTASDIKKLGTILSVWAHPDDESWCAAGILAAAVQNGQRVICITATRGEGGKTADEARWPQEKLAEIRTAELENALQILGIKEHVWLEGYKDGELKAANPENAISAITKLIEKTQPDTILTFGSDGLTGHDDHKTVFSWAQRAVEQAGSQAEICCVSETTEKYALIPPSLHNAIYFNTRAPKLIDSDKADILFELPEEVRQLKLAALRAQPCQMEPFFSSADGTEYLEKTAASEAFTVV